MISERAKKGEGQIERIEFRSGELFGGWLMDVECTFLGSGGGFVDYPIGCARLHCMCGCGGGDVYGRGWGRMKDEG